MHLALLAAFFMSLKPTVSIPLDLGLNPSTDIFSWSGDSDLFDSTTFSEPGSPDISLASPTDDFTDLFSPSSFLAENSGNENDDLQFLLSSTDTGTFCPLRKSKRDPSGYCGSSEAPPSTLAIPSIIDNPPGQEEGSSAGAGVTTGGVGNDPCAIQIGFPVHVCCGGPQGARSGAIYATIENCRLGQLFFTISFPFMGTKKKESSNQSYPRTLDGFIFSRGQILDL